MKTKLSDHKEFKLFTFEGTRKHQVFVQPEQQDAVRPKGAKVAASNRRRARERRISDKATRS